MVIHTHTHICKCSELHLTSPFPSASLPDPGSTRSPHGSPHLCTSPSGLGARLVLVVGVQDQIDQMLRERRILPRYLGGYRLTDRETMKVVIEAVGVARTQCEQSLSKVCVRQRTAWQGVGGNRRVTETLSLSLTRILGSGPQRGRSYR